MALPKPANSAVRAVVRKRDNNTSGATQATTVAEPVTKGVQQGKQSQISLAMPPELLARVDAAAERLSISRAGFIKMTLAQAVEQAPIH